MSDAVTLVDAHAYEPEVFAAPSSPDQLRPFFSLKSALYAGRFAHTDTDTAIAVAVKFWLCPDQRLENEVSDTANERRLLLQSNIILLYAGHVMPLPGPAAPPCD